MPSVRYVLGTINILRQHFFHYFLHPPPPCQHFFYTYPSVLFPQFLTPITLKSADVLYGWSLAGLNVSDWEWGQKSFCHIVPLAQCTVGHLYDWVWLHCTAIEVLFLIPFYIFNGFLWLYFLSCHFFVKVQIFWEGYKYLKKISHFWLT